MSAHHQCGLAQEYDMTESSLGEQGDVALGEQDPAPAEKACRSSLAGTSERNHAVPVGIKAGRKQRETSVYQSDGLRGRATSMAKTSLLFLLSQWLLVMFGITILVAYLVPNVARRGGYLAAEYSISYGALAVIFLVAGLTMPTRLLWINLGSWKIHLITQSMCFIITPLVGLAIVECIVASGTEKISPLTLVGIVIMVCTPTTVASNITFTRLSGGDEATALVEVTIGNLLGIFISPALAQLFLRPSLGLGVGAPTQGVGLIYKELIKHFGLALYLPLFGGQLIRNLWTKEVDKVSKLIYLPKWASICLLLLVWETFSDAFASGAFKSLSMESIILVVFLNVSLYPFFTLLCYLFCRPPSSLLKYQISRGQTTAVCFCGPPKSITVGIVLISIQYSNFSALDQAIIAIPLSLYQGLAHSFGRKVYMLISLRYTDIRRTRLCSVIHTLQ